MKTPLVSILFFLAASVFGAVGQYLYKSGADSILRGQVRRPPTTQALAFL